jgi:branched-chain amino acid transport system permease protein
MAVDTIVQVALSGLLMGLVYALIAIGFTLVFGVLDVVNFAHGHIVMVAMFVVYVLYVWLGVDPYLSLVGVAPLFFLLGLVLFRLLIKRLVEMTHASHTVVTLGLFIFLENAANLIFGGDLRGITTSYTSTSFNLGGISIPIARLGAAGVSVLLLVALGLFLTRSSFGMAIRAAAQNRTGAHLVGVDVGRVYAVTFALSVVLAGIAGAVLMPFSLASPFVGASFMHFSFAIAIIGGLGSMRGAFVAALIVGLVEALAGLWFTGSFGNTMVFLILVLVLLYRPSGLFGRAAS